jgi:hypothetical protein
MIITKIKFNFYYAYYESEEDFLLTFQSTTVTTPSILFTEL